MKLKILALRQKTELDTQAETVSLQLEECRGSIIHFARESANSFRKAFALSRLLVIYFRSYLKILTNSLLIEAWQCLRAFLGHQQTKEQSACSSPRKPRLKRRLQEITDRFHEDNPPKSFPLGDGYSWSSGNSRSTFIAAGP